MYCYICQYSLEELNILTNSSIEVALKPLFLHLHYTTKQMCVCMGVFTQP